MTSVARTIDFIEKKGISKTKFYKDTGLSNGYLDKVKELGADKIESIISAYEEINLTWLITGVGPMYKRKEATATQVIEGEDGIPLLPIKAMAGIFSGEVQVMDYESDRYLVPAFKDADFLIPIRGSSMYPKYSSGDIVACKRLESWSFFQMGKVYVIYTSQGPVVKRIKAGKDENHILVVSENCDKYPAFQLSIKEIKGVALVIGVIRLE